MLGSGGALCPLRPSPSCCREQLRQPDQIIGGGCEGERESDPAVASKLRLVPPGDRLDPAEALLNALADALAEPVAVMLRRARVDGRRPAAHVLRYMRRHPHRPQIVDEVLCVAALISGERDPSRPVCTRLDHMERGDTFGVAVGFRQQSSTKSGVAVLHQRMAYETQLRLLARALAIKPHVRSGRGGVRVIQWPKPSKRESF